MDLKIVINLFTDIFVVDVASASTSTLVKFNQSSYSVNESDGQMQPVLLLSDPLSTNITVQVINLDITATGK